MKQNKFKFFFFFLVSLTNFYSILPVKADSDFNTRLYEKVYVDPANLIVNHEGIFFINAQGSLQTAAVVSVDSQGVYIFVPQFWYCERCGRDHWGACPMDF